jgi:hypothetical protein
MAESLIGISPTYIHTIGISIANAGASQTDTITIDGIACTYTSDATPTTAEVSAGLLAAIAASSAAGKFFTSGTTNVVLTPALGWAPSVTVSPNLTNVPTICTPVLGTVMGDTKVVAVTPVISTDAYAANDIVGGKITLTNAMRTAAGTGSLDFLSLVDTSKQNAPMYIHLFKADLAGTYNDNAPEAVTAADWLNWLGCVSILATDYLTKATASLADLGGIGLKVKATSSPNLYALIVTTGTPTYGANALQLTFGLGRN